MGRSALCLRGIEGRGESDRGRYHHLLPRAHVGLQDTEGRGVRRHSEDIDREDPEVFAAQPGGFGEGDFGVSFCSVIPERCASIEPGISRFRVWCWRTIPE